MGLAPSPGSAVEARPVRVLIVDDDEDMRALLGRALRREGLQVEEQPTGDRVLNLLADERYDLVILDKEMPGINGLDLLALLRRRHPGTPVIFITAFGGTRLAEEVVRLGASRYLEKPFRVGELLVAVRGAVTVPPAAAS